MIAFVEGARSIEYHTFRPSQMGGTACLLLALLENHCFAEWFWFTLGDNQIM